MILSALRLLLLAVLAFTCTHAAHEQTTQQLFGHAQSAIANHDHDTLRRTIEVLHDQQQLQTAEATDLLLDAIRHTDRVAVVLLVEAGVRDDNDMQALRKVYWFMNMDKLEDGAYVINYLMRKMRYPENPLFPAIRSATHLRELGIARFLLEYVTEMDPVDAACRAAVELSQPDVLGTLARSRLLHGDDMFERYIAYAQRLQDPQMENALKRLKARYTRSAPSLLSSFPALHELPQFQGFQGFYGFP